MLVFVMWNYIGAIVQVPSSKSQARRILSCVQFFAFLFVLLCFFFFLFVFVVAVEVFFLLYKTFCHYFKTDKRQYFMTVLDEQDSIPKRVSIPKGTFVKKTSFLAYCIPIFFFQKKIACSRYKHLSPTMQMLPNQKNKITNKNKKTIEAACCSVMPILCGSKKLLQHVLLVTHLWFVLGKALSTYLGR